MIHRSPIVHTPDTYTRSFLLSALNIVRTKDFMKSESNARDLKAQFWVIEGPLKMTKNAIYFISKSSFCSQDIYIFVMNFWSCIKAP